jgi:Family of unknown function (DUF6314)
MMDLADFLGSWSFERSIRDPNGAETGQTSGTVTLSGDANSAVYAESGTLILPGQPPMKATRRYLWYAAPSAILVTFDDGRAFHTIDLGGQSAMATHWCDPDDYAVAYDFSDWPLWSSDWRVKGPRKDYRLRTTYRRA